MYSNIFAQVISGIQLPPSVYSASNKADVLVVIEIFGVPNDEVKQQTRVIKRNGELLIYFIELLAEKLKKLYIDRVLVSNIHKAKVLHYVQDDESVICNTSNLIIMLFRYIFRLWIQKFI